MPLPLYGVGEAVMFLGCLSATFVWTALIIAVSHERLKRPRWNL